jgi:hypothetical protein
MDDIDHCIQSIWQIWMPQPHYNDKPIMETLGLEPTIKQQGSRARERDARVINTIIRTIVTIYLSEKRPIMTRQTSQHRTDLSEVVRRARNANYEPPCIHDVSNHLLLGNHSQQHVQPTDVSDFN